MYYTRMNLTQYLTDLCTFAASVFHNWILELTGSVVAWGLAMWAIHRQKPIQKRIALSISALCLFFAFFNAWREQYASAAWRGNRISELAQRVDQLESEVARMTPQAPTAQAPKKNANGNQTVVGSKAQITQQSSGDCSPNTIGNGNTTVCTPISRAMPTAKLEAFASELKSTTGTIRVIPQSSAADVFELQRQICDAANEAHWPNTCSDSRSGTIGPSRVVKGLQCYSDDWTANDAAAFKRAITAGGLACHYNPHQYVVLPGVYFNGTSGVTILIGDPQ